MSPTTDNNILSPTVWGEKAQGMDLCPFLVPAGLAEMTLPSPLSLAAFISLVALLLTQWTPSSCSEAAGAWLKPF